MRHRRRSIFERFLCTHCTVVEVGEARAHLQRTSWRGRQRPTTRKAAVDYQQPALHVAFTVVLES